MKKRGSYLDLIMKSKIIPKSKRSQVTIFIVIALIVVIGIVLYIVVRGGLGGRVDPAFAPVHDFVVGCLEESVDESVKGISLGGGYNEVEGASYLLSDVPYYFSNGKVNIPDKKKVEEEFNDYIKESMVICINEFGSIQEQGFTIEYNEMRVDTKLGDEIEVRIDYPISASKGEASSSFRKFKVEKNFNFNRIMKLVDEFKKEHQENPNFIPVSFLSLFAEREGFTFDLIYTGESEVVYSFLINDVYESPILFNFAALYDWEIKSNEEKIELKEIGTLRGFEGKEFSYKVEVEKGEGISFTDFTGMFDIDMRTGEVKFVPTPEDIGRHEILIKGFDSEGNSDTAFMVLEVEGDLID